MAANSGNRTFMRSLVMLQTQAEAAGAQEISRIVGNGLEARGWDVHHVFLYRRTKTLDVLGNVYYCADERPSGIIAYFKIVGRLFRHLRKIRPAAVFTFQHYGNMMGGPIAKVAGVRNVIATRTTSNTQLPFFVELLDVLVGLLPAYTRIVVNSRETELEVARYPAIYRKKTVRIDHGFDLKRSKLSKTEAREAFGLPQDVAMLGCVARLHPQKNQQAAIRMLPEQPGWHLALAGQGQHREELEALATELGCRDRLHFIGEISPQRIGDFLATLDVFVFPSIAESFGLAPVEAAQAGIPVVANRLPVLEEVLAVDGGACALLTNVANTRAFAAAVARVLEGGPDIERMIMLGQQLGQKYSADAMVDGYAVLLEEKQTAPVAVRAQSQAL